MNNNGHGHTGFTGSSLYQTTNSSTSTLRPRNNRLISYEDGIPTDASIASTTSASSTPPRFNSRNASPSIASGSQVRSKTKNQNFLLRDDSNHIRPTSASAYANSDRRASANLWESISNFPGIASSFLNNDASITGVKRSSSLHKPGPGRMLFDKSSAPKQAPQEWGPSSQTPSQPTSIEEQRALLQAKRREILLSQSVQQQKDTLGRYKRKDSNADLHPPYDPKNDTDILVYRHKVLPNDTMAGVVIKYNCQPEAFRKANRFWPNDNIQRRTHVVLPIAACGIKGRKTDGPYIADITSSTALDTPHTTKNGTATSNSIDGSKRPSLAEPFPPAEVDEDYRHDCWVMLPSFPQPVEILRVPKSASGYFPPARRKSITNSPFTDSATSTPKTSFDMLRHPPTHAAQQAAAQFSNPVSLSLNSSPIRQSSVPRHLTSASRTRSSSTISNPNGQSQNAFLTSLQGPGGVGTLRGLRTERARPGPAEDPLNKKFAQYIPDLLPPEQDAANALGSSLRPPNSRATSNSLRTTPRASMDSIRSTRSNSSSVPAAIAGWVGKVATSPMRRKIDNGITNAARNSNNDIFGQPMGMGMGMSDLGDLIELDATPDEVSKQLHDDITPTATPTIGVDGREDDDSMNERFPVRGRVRRAYMAE